MTQIDDRTNQVQVTAARPEGWSLRSLLVRGAIVFLTIVLIIAGSYLVISLALRPTDCCFGQNGQSCTSTQNCYCFGPDATTGNTNSNEGDIRPCPVGGPELCTVNTACYFPPALFPFPWGSKDRAFYVTPSGQRLPCAEVVGAS